MHEEHDLEELEEASGRNARDAADLEPQTAEVLLEAHEHPIEIVDAPPAPERAE